METSRSCRYSAVVVVAVIRSVAADGGLRRSIGIAVTGKLSGWQSIVSGYVRVRRSKGGPARKLEILRHSAGAVDVADGIRVVITGIGKSQRSIRGKLLTLCRSNILHLSLIHI